MDVSSCDPPKKNTRDPLAQVLALLVVFDILYAQMVASVSHPVYKAATFREHFSAFWLRCLPHEKHQIQLGQSWVDQQFSVSTQTTPRSSKGCPMCPTLSNVSDSAERRAGFSRSPLSDHCKSTFSERKRPAAAWAFQTRRCQDLRHGSFRGLWSIQLCKIYLVDNQGVLTHSQKYQTILYKSD